jgi:ribonuclease J
MKIKIHRGTEQIGGSVVEIFTDSTRIFLDLGSPLPDGDGNSANDVLQIEGVTTGEPRCDAVLFSHYHGDHIGMMGVVLPEVPVYMGTVAKEIYLILQKRVRNGIPEIVDNARTFEPGIPFDIGDIHITPFVVDHAAFDAYMFLIEAEGKRILYTGDFRTHGFRGKAVIPMLQKYVGQVDVLIIEGTMLSRTNTEVKTEQALQKEFHQYLSKYKYAFVISSSTNIDRIGSICQATPKEKDFLCDEYQMEVLTKVRELSGHHSPLYRFEKANSYKPSRDEAMERNGFCMLIRGQYTCKSVVDYYTRYHPDETILLYSMWDGYLKQPNNQYAGLLKKFKHVEHAHTSGHATFDAIVEVCSTVKPTTAIIPMHSENRHKMEEAKLPYHIEYLEDGEIYRIV